MQMYQMSVLHPSMLTYQKKHKTHSVDLMEYPKAIERQGKWLDVVDSQFHSNLNNTESGQPWITWAAYHAQQAPGLEGKPPDNSAMLPLFQEETHSVSMILHSMNIIKKAVHFLNPDQIPVVTFDQPLYAIAENMQWYWQDTRGRSFCCTQKWQHSK